MDQKNEHGLNKHLFDTVLFPANPACWKCGYYMEKTGGTLCSRCDCFHGARRIQPERIRDHKE